MAMPGRIYRCTEAGRKAWDTQNVRVPLEHRKVLGLMAEEIHGDTLKTRLSRYSEPDLLELLADLELRGLIASREDGAENDLDFTASINVSDLLAAHNK